MQDNWHLLLSCRRILVATLPVLLGFPACLEWKGAAPEGRGQSSCFRGCGSYVGGLPLER